MYTMYNMKIYKLLQHFMTSLLSFHYVFFLNAYKNYETQIIKV